MPFYLLLHIHVCMKILKAKGLWVRINKKWSIWAGVIAQWETAYLACVNP